MLPVDSLNRMLLQPEIVQRLNTELYLAVLHVVFNTPQFHLATFFEVFVEPDLLHESAALKDHVVEAHITTKLTLDLEFELCDSVHDAIDE